MLRLYGSAAGISRNLLLDNFIQSVKPATVCSPSQIVPLPGSVCAIEASAITCRIHTSPLLAPAVIHGAPTIEHSAAYRQGLWPDVIAPGSCWLTKSGLGKTI